MIKIAYSSKRYTLVLLLMILFMAAPAAWADITHTVKKGESLSAISQQYHVSISKIKEANHLGDTRLQIGQRLTIPKTPAPISNSSSSPNGNRQITASDQEIPDTYVVKSGDTLSGIGKRYGLTVKELQEINELKGTRLQIGQVLELKGDEEIPDPISRGADVIEEEGDSPPVVKVAESFLGVKYRRGGTNAKTGLDCSAYVQKVFQVVGKDLPRTAREQFGVGMEVSRDALQLGDLVFFKRSKAKRPAHVGIYIGDEQFIHASNTKRRVRIDSLNTRYFSAKLIGARRIQETKIQPEIPAPGVDDSQVYLAAFEPALNVPLLSVAPQPTPSASPDL